MHGIYDIHVISEMTGQKPFNNIAGQWLSIHFRQISCIINYNLFDSFIVNLSSDSAQFLSESEVRLKLVHNARCYWRHVYCVLERLISQDVQNLLRYIDSHILLGFNRRSTQVRSYDNFRVVQERVIWLWRLMFKYVESSSSYDSLIHSFHKCILINNSAAGTVNDTHAFFHNRKLWRGDNSACFRC
ncbi:hypothetical protein D3C81_1362180 [compost metagenome]